MKNPTVIFNDTPCTIIFGKYHNNQRTSIELYEQETGEPFMTASVNLPNHPLLEDEVAIKDYSENEGIADALAKAGIIKIIARANNGICFCKLLIK